jgi:phage terminase large subunit-like protein
MRRRNTFFAIDELEHRQISKETRIRGLLGRFASNSVTLVEGWCDDLIGEMVEFPRGIHDDLLDAVAYQQQIIEIEESSEKPTKVVPSRGGRLTRWS